MIRKMTLFAVMAMLIFVASQVTAGVQPGRTDTVFNKRFIQKIKPMMSYEQLVKIIGTSGIKTGENKSTSTPVASYHWNGGRESALDVKTKAGKVVEATMFSPNKHKYSIDKNGKIMDMEK